MKILKILFYINLLFVGYSAIVGNFKLAIFNLCTAVFLLDATKEDWK